MIEAEFLVQAWQMRAGIWEPNWERALGRLRENKAISNADAARAANSCELLRGIETALRRFENKNVSTLPAATADQEKLRKRLGYEDLDLFAKEYRAGRDTIHSLYQSYVKERIA
jgi:glutamine synthetase adenylyltransferase